MLLCKSSICFSMFLFCSDASSLCRCRAAISSLRGWIMMAMRLKLI